MSRASGRCPFDCSDVDAELERSERAERQLRQSRELIARAFAQGFTAALEDDASAEWVDYYRSRAS